MGALEQWVIALADEWWVHPIVLALAMFDGFFPVLPSESVIVSLASLSSTTGKPWLWLLAPAAWIGACAGDCIAYQLGRAIGWQRFRYFREGRGHRAVLAAERGLRRRAFVFLMTARYIPVGRVAVNFVAGAVDYPFRKFLLRDAIATAAWAVYSTAIGLLAGQWFEGHSLLGMVVAVGVALVVSVAVERIVSALHARADARRSAEEIEEDERRGRERFGRGVSDAESDATMER